MQKEKEDCRNKKKPLQETSFCKCVSDINIIIKSQADKSIHFHHMALQSILLYILYDYILNYTEIKRSLLQRLLFISIIVFLFLHL